AFGGGDGIGGQGGEERAEIEQGGNAGGGGGRIEDGERGVGAGGDLGSAGVAFPRGLDAGEDPRGGVRRDWCAGEKGEGFEPGRRGGVGAAGVVGKALGDVHRAAARGDGAEGVARHGIETAGLDGKRGGGERAVSGAAGAKWCIVV